MPSSPVFCVARDNGGQLSLSLLQILHTIPSSSSSGYLSLPAKYTRFGRARAKERERERESLNDLFEPFRDNCCINNIFNPLHQTQAQAKGCCCCCRCVCCFYPTHQPLFRESDISPAPSFSGGERGEMLSLKKSSLAPAKIPLASSNLTRSSFAASLAPVLQATCCCCCCRRSCTGAKWNTFEQVKVAPF